MSNSIGLLKTIAALSLLILLASCSGSSSTPPAAPPDKAPPAPTSDFKAALVTPCPINDGGWGQNAYKGLKKIEGEMNAKVSNVVANSSQEFFDAARNYAADGYSVVFGHASEWYDPKLLEIAKANPNTIFIISGSENATPPNVSGIRFVLEDATYVLGFLAGSMTKSNVVGCVGPEKIPVIGSTFETFEAGVKAANPNASVRIVWTENSKDVAKAKEMTLALISEKADFIFQNANNGGLGVFDALKQSKGVYGFGSNDDQSPSAPDAILASAVLDVPGAFISAAKKIKEQKFEPKTLFLGMPDGSVGVAFNEKLKAQIPADVLKKTEELIEKIKKGEVKVERKSLK